MPANVLGLAEVIEIVPALVPTVVVKFVVVTLNDVLELLTIIVPPLKVKSFAKKGFDEVKLDTVRVNPLRLMLPYTARMVDIEHASRRRKYTGAPEAPARMSIPNGIVLPAEVMSIVRLYPDIVTFELPAKATPLPNFILPRISTPVL